MKLLSKMLILAIILPYQIVAMKQPIPSAPPLHSLIHYPNPYPIANPSSSSSSSPFFYEYPDAHIGLVEELPQPKHINRFSNPLRAETVAHVEKCSRSSALFGTLFGGCATYLYVQNSNLSLCSNLPLWKEMGFTVAGAFSSGALAYVAAQWFTTRRTAEKQYEAAVNKTIIDPNNAAFAAKCNLDADERDHLNTLMNGSEPENRVLVYDYALTLHHQPKQAKIYPVGDAVKYLDNTAQALKHEGEALGNMKIERPSPKTALSDDKEAELKQIMKDVQSTYQAIYQLNRILPAQKITNWTSAVKQLPEYKYQTAQEALQEEYKELKRREKDIQYHLARLAALRGHIFSQAYLSKTFAHHLLVSFSTDYSNTPQGRRARAMDINQSKNNISSLMQAYQTRALDYSNAVITHNETIAKVPETIKVFIAYRRGNINKRNGYVLNKKLLEYNHYLNHNDGDALWTWVESCFSDN